MYIHKTKRLVMTRQSNLWLTAITIHIKKKNLRKIRNLLANLYLKIKNRMEIKIVKFKIQQTMITKKLALTSMSYKILQLKICKMMRVRILLFQFK